MLERERACGCLQFVGAPDIGLEQHRNPMQRPAYLAGLALGVERVGDRERVWIGVDHGAELGPPTIERLDPPEVERGDPARGVAAGLHGALQLIDRDLVELEAAGGGAALCTGRLAEIERRSRTGERRSGWDQRKKVSSLHGSLVASVRRG
jgi:hypothetical protein